MNLKNIPHLDWLIPLLALVEVIMPSKLLLMVIGVLLIVWLLQIRNENKLKHSRDIVKDFQYSEVVLESLHKGNLTLKVKPYPDEINEHLGDAYIDTKEMIERRNIYIKLYNIELNEFYSDLKEDILNSISKNLFNKENIEIIESDILRVIYSNNQYPVISFRINSHDNIHDLVCVISQNIWIVSENKNELIEIRNKIIKKFDDAIERKFKFKLLLYYYKEITIYQTDINKELQHIIDKIRTESTPLKGTCSKCLNENIFGDINGTTSRNNNN